MSKRAPGGLSSSAEDYIKAILQLTRGEAAVRVTDLANKLGIAKSSVTEAMMALKERGLVTQERYGRIFLTAEGLAEAERIRRRHLVLSAFLRDILGVGRRQSEVDACQIEHVVSTETMRRILEFLEKNLPIVENWRAQNLPNCLPDYNQKELSSQNRLAMGKILLTS